MTTAKDRAAIEAHLNNMAQSNNGEITPDMVWDDAQNPNSPLRLHPSFEWNEKAGWRKHNLQVARNLIASVDIVWQVNKVEIKLPRYTKDPNLPRKTQGYMDVTQVKQRNDEDLARQIISQELGRTRQALERAQGYASYFDDMETEIKSLTKRILKLEDQLAA